MNENITKKILTCITLVIVLSISCISCGKEDNNQENQSLTEPDYETSSVTTTEIKDKLNIVDGWVVKSMIFDGNEEYLYYPYVENKKAGVSYWEDSVDTRYSSEKYANINRPKGCKNLKQTVSGCSDTFTYQPKFGYNKDEYLRENKTNPMQVLLEGIIYYNDGTDMPGRDKEAVMTSTKQDVQAISCALYEDFYEAIPQLTIKIYGIPLTLWEDTLGSNMKFSYNEYEQFIQKCQNDGFLSCKQLAKKDVSETDVYYIDYNELEKSGDFAQYLIVLEFDKSMEYTYRVCGDATYEISDASEYNKWKQDNADKFIN